MADNAPDSPGEPTATPTPATVPLETVERLVGEFKNATREIVQSIPVAAPAPVAPPADPRQRYAEAREKATELAKDDPVAAFELLATTIQEAAPKADPTADPAYKALRTQARRLAATAPEIKAIIERYGPEVESIVAGMPPARQIDVAAWEEAVGIARGKHFDELVADERKTWEADRAKTAPPTAGGSRARTASGTFAAQNLSPDQLGVAKSLGITPERYAQLQTELSAATGPDGAIIGVDLVPAGLPEPGRF